MVPGMRHYKTCRKNNGNLFFCGNFFFINNQVRPVRHPIHQSPPHSYRFLSFHSRIIPQTLFRQTVGGGHEKGGSETPKTP